MIREKKELLLFLALFAHLSGCAKTALDSTSCAPTDSQKTSVNAGTNGQASVFVTDPMVRSGISTLSPTSLKLDNYRTKVALSNLSGKGVLDGIYVNVRNGLSCGESAYSAFDPSNLFVYSHSDSHFQEAMAYYFGDQYRSSLDAAGVLQPRASVKVVAHCMKEDNAYFTRSGSSIADVSWKVCLGDSIYTPGASYADDAIVTVHELQHATTTDTYNPIPNIHLGEFFYDEAGALNEAISDFAGLIYSAPIVGLASGNFDPRVFSRWALGTFIPLHSGVRGAHKCPQYDPTYPNCTNFGSTPFSAASNTMSYIYPDGLGWPYADNFDGPGKLRNAFINYPAQEEIHNAGVLMEGALWDIYDAILANHSGDSLGTQAILYKLTMKAVAALPQPSSELISPTTFRAYASALETVGSKTLNAADRISMESALTTRGLLGDTGLTANWAAQGPGLTEPGIQIIDDPSKLQRWIFQLGGDPKIVTQGIATGLNQRLDPGDVALIRFDIQNKSPGTAGGVLVNVTAPPEVTFLDKNYNEGLVISGAAGKAQIYYGKINGTGIVLALKGDQNFGVPTGNSYFQTNPYTTEKFWTGLWIKVSTSAAHGKKLTFHVDATPSNGPTASTEFYAVVQ